MAQGHFVVAVHDVTPVHDDRIRRILALFGRVGIARPALFVVPDWHGEGNLERHPAFVDMLLERQAAGAEVFLHGHRHDEVGHERSLREHLHVFGRTARSAEFLVIGRDEAARRMDRGLEMFGRLGLEAIGFVPPAWIFGASTRALAAERNLWLTESFLWVESLRARHRMFSPALSWSSARPWRSWMTAGIGDVRTAVVRVPSLVRVAVHPPDIDIPPVRRSLERALERLVRARSAVRYTDLFSRIAP
jgi:predicted deacetylase